MLRLEPPLMPTPTFGRVTDNRAVIPGDPITPLLPVLPTTRQELAIMSKSLLRVPLGPE